MLIEMIQRIAMKDKNKPLSITLVGAGGKTTCLFLLSEELGKEEKNHIITTTTQIFPPEKDRYDQLILTGDQSGDKAIDLKDSFHEFTEEKKGYRVLVGKEITAEGKLKGISKNEYETLRVKHPDYWVINEGDGAKRKSIKAPGYNEPVIPPTTDVVIGIIGLGVLRKKINEESVHRVDEFLGITGKNTEDMITEEDLLSLITHPEGLFKSVLPGVKKILLLNQGEDASLRKAGRDILIKSKCRGAVVSLQQNTLYHIEEDHHVL